MSDIWWLVTQFPYFLTSFDKVVGVGRLTLGPPDGEMSEVMLREELARSGSVMGSIWALKACNGPHIAAL